MARKGILGAGNWIVDIVKKIDRFPQVGELCNIFDSERGGGGGPCNVLFDIAAMEADIPLYAAGMIGYDAEGSWLLNEIKTRHIDCANIWKHQTLPTSYTDVMSGNGKRTFFHCRGANSMLDYEHLSKVETDAKIFYLGYLLLLDKLDGVDPEYGTPAARLLKEMREKGYMTVVDFVSESKEKFLRVTGAALPYIDVLVINEIEAGNTFDLEIRRQDDTINWDNLKLACRKFMEKGVKTMTVVHMPEGAIAIDASMKISYCSSCSIDRADIVGSNGAGDAFCAGMLYGLHENLPVEMMLRIGSASSWYNLQSATASGGAVKLSRIMDQVNNGKYYPTPPEVL